MCDGRSLQPDQQGRFIAVCTCGWGQTMLPDLETVVDVLMQHSREMALLEDS